MTAKYYCRSCGNTLFFKKVIEGTIAIPLEVGEFDEDDECCIYNMKDLEFREVYQSQMECGECGSTNIEEEADDNDTPHNWEDNYEDF